MSDVRLLQPDGRGIASVIIRARRQFLALLGHLDAVGDRPPLRGVAGRASPSPAPGRSLDACFAATLTSEFPGWRPRLGRVVRAAVASAAGASSSSCVQTQMQTPGACSRSGEQTRRGKSGSPRRARVGLMKRPQSGSDGHLRPVARVRSSIRRRTPSAPDPRWTKRRAGGQLGFAFGVPASFSQSEGLYERRSRRARPQLPTDPRRKSARPEPVPRHPRHHRKQVPQLPRKHDRALRRYPGGHGSNALPRRGRLRGATRRAVATANP
jgi:hypothetical protein